MYTIKSSNTVNKDRRCSTNLSAELKLNPILNVNIVMNCFYLGLLVAPPGGAVGARARGVAAAV